MEVRFKLTKYRVALAALFVLAGVGLGNLLSPLVGSALATVGSTTNISDHSASAYFAKVSSDGKLAVGDGAGPLSVDGTVTDRPAAPASPWHALVDGKATLGAQLLAGPSASPINVTSLTLSRKVSGSGVLAVLDPAFVPSSATSCTGATFESDVFWTLLDMGAGTTPLSFTFPTPLQYKPPANTKACLFAGTNDSANNTYISAVGFYGG
jgi:hypothetical protein